jgi:peroxiredoxin
MLTTLILWTSVAAAAQSPERPEWNLAPRLSLGQELIYRGTASEVSLGRGVHFSKNYRLELRVLVYEARGESVHLAILTRLVQEQPTAAGKGTESPASVRLELAELDGRGRLHWSGGSWFDPQGLSTLEAGFVLEVPPGARSAGQTWDLEEAQRPPVRVRLVGQEGVGNLACVRLELEQKSPEWSDPRGDRAAWRRTETLWVHPRLGVVQRLHRILEGREPAHKAATYRLTTHYELESSLRYEGMILEDRRREILAIRQFEESVRALLPRGSQQAAALKQVAARAEQFAARHPATPYREALERVRQLALDASENRLPPTLAVPSAPRLAIGKPAPDFLVHDLKTKEAYSLRRCQGRAVLMVFYQPGAESCRLFMRSIQDLADQFGDQELVVLGFAMSDDADKALETSERMQVRFPTLAGKALKRSYGVESTPRFVVLDSEGVVRAAFTGWGPEIPPALTEAVRKSLPALPDSGR